MGPSSRVVEEAALIEKLSVRGVSWRECKGARADYCMPVSPQPMGLVMREIKADGHCLYRSVEDQLAIEQGAICDLHCMLLRPSIDTTSPCPRRRGAIWQGLPIPACCHRRPHALSAGGVHAVCERLRLRGRLRGLLRRD
jgi:hypothetical protein